jgi:glycosyltransferase involved in cell wall biosynthesis
MHTFSESILAAIRDTAGESNHEFFYYVTGDPPGFHDALRIPYSRRELYTRNAIYQLRNALDSAGMNRHGPHTWFERSLTEQRIDVIWFATNYVERCDLPYVMTVFDIEHVRQPWFPEVSAGGEWERRHHHYSRFIPKATRVIVPNEAGRNQVVQHFRIDPERVLCLGHPTPSFALEAARREPLPRERVDKLNVSLPYLLYPAQFWPHKNHVTAVRVLAALNRMYDPPDLICVGIDKGTKDHVMREANALGVGHRVHTPGRVDQSRLISLYQHADALLYPSLFGPDNLPPLEAMALGCPVVAARVSGAEEQLGKAAVLVDAFDVEAYAEAVRRLRDEPYWRDAVVEMGRERARSWATSQYVLEVLGLIQSRIAPARALWA